MSETSLASRSRTLSRKEPDQPRRLAPVPQKTMVDDDGVGPAVDGPGEQRPRCRNSGHDPLHIARALDLQPVGTVVPHGIGIQEFIEIRDELVEIHDQIVPQQQTVYGGKAVRIASTLTTIGVLAAVSLSVVSCTPEKPSAGEGVSSPSSHLGRPERTLGESGRARARAHRGGTRRRYCPIPRHRARPISALVSGPWPRTGSISSSVSARRSSHWSTPRPPPFPTPIS